MTLEENQIDQTKCMSVKNKNSIIQCKNRRYTNCEYCGIHKKAKIIVRIDQLNNNIPIQGDGKIVHKKIKIITKDNVTTGINQRKYIYSSDDILNCEFIDSLRVDHMMYTIDKLNTLKLVTLEGNSKKHLYQHLYIYYQKYLQYQCNINNIIKIQSHIRGFLIRRRSQAINDEDFYTLDTKYEIQDKYYFDFLDNGFRYCFDIRSFKKILENSNPCNPYTIKPISSKVIFKFNQKISQLKDTNVKLDIEKSYVSPEQAFTHRMVDVFHKFDMLENYTDHRWFEDLSLIQLKELYKRAEDIWNYRSQLDSDEKKKIITTGIAFDIPIHHVHKIKSQNKRKLQNIILDEFERFSSQGLDINEKKLGVMLMLTALVEVSPVAADALPHLIQYN